jgi:glycosyltransferase involved in cell wall biosynthesis
MKDAAEKTTGKSGESLRDAYVEECSRLKAQLADTYAKLQHAEREHERTRDELSTARRKMAETSKSPYYRLFVKLQSLDRRRLAWRAFYLLRDLRRAKTRYSRALSRLGVKLEYVPLLCARSAATRGHVFFSELVPASDSPRKVMWLRSPDAAYTYAFTCGFDGLAQISLALDASHASYETPMQIRIELAGVVVHEETREVHRHKRPQIATFTFGAISRSAGKPCVVTIRSPAANPRQSIGVVLAGDRQENLPSMSVNSEVALAQTPGEAAFNVCFMVEGESSSQRRALGWRVKGSTGHYTALYGDRVASFSFQAPIEPPSGVYVFFDNGGRASYTEVRTTLDIDGVRVWQGEFSTRLIQDCDRFRLPIPQSALDESAGRSVSISLSSPSAGSDQFVFLLGTPIGEVSSSERFEFEKGVNFDEITRFPLDQALSAPIFRDAFRHGGHRLRVSILDGGTFVRDEARSRLDTLLPELLEAGHDCAIYRQGDLKELLAILRDSDVVVVPDQDYSDPLRETVTEVRMSYGIVVGLPLSKTVDSKLMAACTSIMPSELPEGRVTTWLHDLVSEHRKKTDLSVSIVTVLYRKEREIPLFLSCLARQDFKGQMELVVVNDCSPDRSKEILLESYEALKRQGYSLPTLKILDNLSNSGNCASRNRALPVVTGDVVVIVDADCLLNHNFISAHVHSHLFHDASVVTGPCNLESGLADPIARLKEYERSPERVEREAELQDSINLDSFVNCITRNFSILRTAISEELFDEQFGYSASPESGFGWEDVEMGYRLYKRGLKLYFTPRAISVHVTHQSSTEDKIKPIKSLKNFRRLIEKHPSIALDARRWFQDTFAKIEQWSAACGHPVQDDQRIIREKLGQLYPYPFAIVKNRELRIVTYRWHVPHQYELYKLPHRFTLLRGLGTGFTSDWLYEQRPMPKSANFLPVERFKVKDADVAILHFDENVLQPENCNGVISKDWGDNFRYFMEQMKGIPKVAVCHGTPQFIGQYNPGYNGADLGKPIENSREELVRYLSDVPVVCNSHQALREWGFKNARVIWHGFDPSEFQVTTYEGGILTLGAAMKERPYYRGYGHYQKVCEMLPAEFRPDFHSVGRPALGITNSHRYAQLKFEEYRRSIRRYSVYFNPTLRSPMPRSRGEAMMSGLVTVSAANHDVELFIKNGWNGFYAQTSEEMAEHLLFLMRNKRACREMGVRSRETAADVFNHDRYLHAWQNLLTDLVKG